MKIYFFYFGKQHTWKLFPTLIAWRNNFRSVEGCAFMGDNYAISLCFLNQCVGMNIKFNT